MQEHPSMGMLPVGLIDGDQRKQGQLIHGVPVVGNFQLIPTIAKSLSVDKIIIALPEAIGPNIRQIINLSKEANLPVGLVSSEGESSGDGGGRIRDVRIEDLLRNQPIQIDDDNLRRNISRKRLLVTGAGGSIGSELCRQLAQYAPAELALLGHGEHSIFTLASEFARLHPQLPVARLIADVRDTDRLQRTFETFRPDIVFHAAAHKHVSLMEWNIEDAISNNVLGTQNVIKASLDHGVENFILISTDKAVNPTSVMGATKRIAELIVSEAARQSGRCYLSVRFGNVLSSRGSVLSIFREQIARGGPVTVTHPEMRRYFMTIEEAVNLVLQSMLLGRGGEIFVLDMGEPLKIADMARDLIELAGLNIGRDIALEFTGIQPGEKLSEELFLQSGSYERTKHEKILVSCNGRSAEPQSASSANQTLVEGLDEQIDALVDAARKGKRSGILQQLKRIVPEYKIENGLAPTWPLPEQS
jgi:FlaA1/EpsC-like NDP-sugar epimerase